VTANSVKIDHADPVFGHLSLLKAVGSTDSDFLGGLKKQLVNAGSHGSAADEDGINFMLAVVKGIEPRDQIEAMLGAQMAAASCSFNVPTWACKALIVAALADVASAVSALTSGAPGGRQSSGGMTRVMPSFPGCRRHFPRNARRLAASTLTPSLTARSR